MNKTKGQKSILYRRKHHAKSENVYENDSHSNNGLQRLINLSVEKSDSRINSDRSARSKTEDNISWHIVLQSVALEHAVNSVAFLSYKEQRPPIRIQLAIGSAMEASRWDSLRLLLAITYQFLARRI